MAYRMRLLARTLAALIVALAASFTTCMAVAQMSSGAPEFVPAQPSSADTVFLKIPRACPNVNYLTPGYRVSAINGWIGVSILLARPSPPCPSPIPPASPLLVEIGRLPPGNYTVGVNEHYPPLSFEPLVLPVANGLQLTVSDHRATKAAPGVRLNYSDHWWDPSNPGSGLFIWQDAQDQLLAAWFTYGTDGNAAWYTIQSGRWITATHYEGRLVQTSRFPVTVIGPGGAGGLIDANGPTVTQLVGTASLDFSGSDEGTLAGVFSYQFDNGTARIRNIRRFNK